MDAKLRDNGDITKNNAVKEENKTLTINVLTPRETAQNEAAKTRINLPVPYGAERLNLPVNIYKGVKTKTGEKTTLKTFFATMQDGDPLSISTSESLKTAYLTYQATGNKEPYNKIKNDLKGVVLGDYSTRTDNDCTVYYGLLGMDIDGYNDGLEMSWDLETLKKNPFVFAAFPSPSGHGLRVFIWTDSTFETHKATYKSLLSYLSDWLHVTTDKDKNPHLDPSTSNPCRLWFFTHTTDVYLNLDSQVFTPSVLTATEPQTTATPAKSDVKKPHTNDRALTETEKIEACIEMVKAFNINTGRNNFVYNVACKCVEHGVTSDAILNHCMTAYAAEDFTKAEIQKTVNSAVKRVQFGKYTDAQLLKYLKNGDPSVIQDLNKTTTATPSVIQDLNKKTTATPSVPGPDKTKTATPSESKAKTPKNKVETKAIDDDETDDDDEFDDRKTPKITMVKNYLSRKKDFRRNEISFRIEVSPKGKDDFEVVNVADLYCELLEKARLNGIKDILDNLMKSSFIPKFNPIKDYFENSSKKWDESQPDWIGLFSNHVKAKDQFWFNTQFKKALVRTVACGLGVISFNKQCFTLVGKQNDGKSSLIRFLAETPKLKPYIKENPRMEHKDSLFALARNLILNYDELDSATKADVAKLKSYFSIGDFQERKHFGDFDESFVRIGSFFGSTNRTDFLNDETGSVRWLVMEIDGIDFAYKQKIDIDWVWAQAYFLLKNGFDFQMTKDEITYSEKANKRFTQTSYEMELIQGHYKAGTPDDFDFFWNAQKISDDLAGANRKLVFEKIGSALKKLGFIQERKWSAETQNTINGYYLKKLSKK